MDDKEILEIDKQKLEKLMAWQNHRVDLEKKQIENDVARSKAKWVFWFALLTFLNGGFAVFNLISNFFK